MLDLVMRSFSKLDAKVIIFGALVAEEFEKLHMGSIISIFRTDDVAVAILYLSLVSHCINPLASLVALSCFLFLKSWHRLRITSDIFHDWN